MSAGGLEALVGLAGLGLAIPGVIDVLIRAGLYLQDMAKRYQHADETVRKFELIGQSMARGQLNSQVAIITIYARNTKVDDAIVQTLDTYFRQLANDILKAHRLLRRIKPPSRAPDDPALEDKLSVLSKLKLTFLDEIRMKSYLDRISATQIAFGNASLLCFQVANGPDTKQLTGDDFVVPQETAVATPGTRLPHSPMLITHARYMAGTAQMSGDVILERRLIQRGGIEDVGALVRKLQSKPCAEGILPCLGFRENPHSGGREYDLVFELPIPSDRESLWQYLRRANRPASLSARKAICEQLAQAISYVHGIGMVHKNIRPANILLVKTTRPASAIPAPAVTAAAGAGAAIAAAPTEPPMLTTTTLFLTDWTLTRSFRSITALLSNSAGAWAEQLYLHPVRQKQQIEEHYTILHDIYSLGVVMLEVLLDVPLVDGTGTQADPFILGPMLRTAFVTSGLVAGASATTPSAAFFADPAHVQTVLVGLATRELPRRVGDRLAALTVQCLEGFGGLFGPANPVPVAAGDGGMLTDEQIARETADGMRFISTVLLEFNAITL